MRTRFFTAVGLVLSALAGSALAEDGKDSLGDPLPPGAKARLGTERMRNLDGFTPSILTPDGTAIIINGPEGPAKIDVKTGLSLGKFGTKQPSLLSADAKRGVILTFDSVQVFEIENGKKLAEVKRRLYSSESYVSVSKDGGIVAVGGMADDKAKDKGVSVIVHSVADDKELASIKIAQNNSGRVVLSADGKVLATHGYHYEQTKPGDPPVDPSASPSLLIQFWEAATGKAISTARMDTTPVAVAISGDGQVAAASSNDGSVTLFDTKTGKAKKRLLGRSRLGSKLLISGDDLALAAVADDGAIQMWELATGKSLGVTPCPDNYEVTSLRSTAFPTRDRLVALTIRGVTTVVWEAPSGKRLSPAGGSVSSLSGVAFTNDDKEVLSGNFNGQLTRWDITGKELGAARLTIPGSPNTQTNSPYGNRLQMTTDGKLGYRIENYGFGLYDLTTGVQHCSLPSDNTYGTQVAISKDGAAAAIVVSAPYSTKPKPGKVILVDLGKKETTGEFALPDGMILAATLTSDGKKLAVLRRVQKEKGADFVLNGFELPAGKQISEAKFDETYGTNFLVATPSKDTVLFARAGGGITEQDIATGEKVRDFVKSAILTCAPVFSADGKSVALCTGSAFGYVPADIEVRDWENGKVTNTFRGHSRPAAAMAFSKNGKMLASAGGDTTVLIWDLTKPKD